MPYKNIKAFAGLRVVALLLIVLFHIMPQTFRSGYLMVNLFLVLSGYLLTLRLNNPKTKLWPYFFDKVKALWVTLVWMMALVLAIFYLLDASLIVGILKSSLSSITFTNNWFQIFNEASYFDQLTRVEIWTHLWYLAVHVQSFFIFTALFCFFRKIKASSSSQIILIALITLASMGAMAVGFLFLKQPLSVYYYTSTRLFTFGLGSLAALIPLENHRFSSRYPGLIAIALIALLLFYQFSEAFLYLGGMQLFAVLSMFLVVTLTQDHWLSKWLSWEGFTWWSKMSFEAYLYSYPLTAFINASLMFLAIELRLLLVIVVLWLVLYLISLFKRLRFKPIIRRLALLVMVGVIVLINPSKDAATLALEQSLKEKAEALNQARVFGASVDLFAKTSLLDYSAQKQEELKRQQLLAEQRKQTVDLDVSKTALEPKEKYEDVEDFVQAMALTSKQRAYFSKMSLTLIGDSILLDTLPTFESTFPNLVMDAKINRQMYHIGSVLDGLLASEQLYDPVIIHLGTNGTFLNKYFDTILEKVGKRQVFMINIKSNHQPWEREVNVRLEKFAKEHENVHLIDWQNFARKHNNIFYKDQEHLTPQGQQIFKDFVAHSLLVEFSK